MAALYPPIAVNHSEMLGSSNDHQLYVETSGNPKGIPVLCLHGGPGAGMSEDYRRLFDPNRYHIIGMDQRGSARSTPFATIEHNTTQDLIEDITMLRKYLGVDSWVLFGGSWGSTLALLAAIDDPKSVRALILRGIFLARQQDNDWFLTRQGGAAQLFPDHYQRFFDPIAALVDQNTNAREICDAYHALFTSSDELHKMAAVRAWCGWEERISRLQHPYGDPLEHDNLHRAIGLAVLECHYLRHGCFIEENAILNQIDRIQHIPGSIIHGRYDMVCKLEAAYSLSQHWQSSQLMIVPDAGHSASEPSIAEALLKATDAMGKFLEESS